ncbi:family 43 glycosylhydrolase [Pontiella sulfatireligans]|uniref:Uncharacterized protein n=1 Tax=Pontiella sulfatireligans TaxID=2750658 RepID=A0A6C2UF10_9BACT|nr:family 43 glycosylhydrolase [Pontiella sulfatireligans]VGO18735.1 hypothetical protein SCARR_00788 [Pontiella sulfatireligans]
MNKFILITTVLLLSIPVIGQQKFDGKYWSSLEPVDTKVPSEKTLEIVLKEPLMPEKGFLRRDSSDIIRVNGKYYIWYTKVYKDQSSFPEGAAGSVWYATSPDGHQWEERGECLPRGDAGCWDDAGVYTPNILVYKGKYYLGYTASKLPFPDHDKYTSAIGMAVSDSPDGPWKKLGNNPVIKPSLTPGTPDGIIVDDTIFIVKEGKIWMYYKGNPNSGTVENPRRTFGNTFLLAATAERPEGPYTKLNKVLHRGHEGVVWKTEDGGIGSLATSRGPLRYMHSTNGVDFKAVYKLTTPKAPSIYRPDFEEGNKGFRPTWGVSQKSKRVGLHRMEFVWPEE